MGYFFGAPCRPSLMTMIATIDGFLATTYNRCKHTIV